MSRHLATTLAALCCISACSGPDQPDQPLLQESDLPPVASSRSFASNGTSNTGCPPLIGVESNLSTTEPETVGRSFQLEDGDQVISSLLGTYVAESTTSYTIDRVQSAIEECVAESSAESFEPLDNLPNGAVGFRSVVDSSNGSVTTERAYARVGEDQVVVVTVERSGGPLTTSVEKLLPLALDRATA